MTTREQLEKRWNTAEGKQKAKSIHRLIDSGTTVDEIRLLIANLPFVEEVAPQLDLRGLHISQNRIHFKYLNLSRAHLEYTYDIAFYGGCTMTGAILDGCYAVNATFNEDFTDVSFVAASLNGVHFTRANLTGTNFSQARLIVARLNEANCTDARFVEADMRFSYCAGADFRGADLSGANLTDAVMGEIKFDERTRLRGTNLTGAGINADFRAFAQEAGAILGEKQGAYDLAVLDTTIAILRKTNDPGHFDQAIESIVTIRPRVVGHPYYPWIDDLVPLVSSEVLEEIIEAQARAMKTMGYYV